MLAIRAPHQFIRRHSDRLETTAGTGMYRQLGEALKRAESYAVEQTSSDLAAQGATQTQRAARKDLRNYHMVPIDQVARLLATEIPELQALKMPVRYLSPDLLVAHARGMAKEADKYKDDFARMGLPADFVESMETAIKRFLDANVEHSAQRAARKGATHGLRAELSKARKFLKVMDAFVTSALHDDAALLAEWRTVKRLPRPKQSAVKAIEANAPLLLTASTSLIEATARIAEEDVAEIRPRWSLRRLLPGSGQA